MSESHVTIEKLNDKNYAIQDESFVSKGKSADCRERFETSKSRRCMRMMNVLGQ